MSASKFILGGIAIVLVIIFATVAVTTVDPGHVGVKVVWGKVQEQGLPAGGPYFYNPFSTRIVEMETRVLRMDATTAAYTKDVQTADVSYTVNYRLDPGAVPYVYANYGLDWSEKLVIPITTAMIKDSIGSMDAVDIIGNRAAIAKRIDGEIAQQLGERNIVLIPGGFQLANIDYTDAFEISVESKVVADQQALAARNHTKRVEEEAKQVVERARAEAESIRIRAAALAENAKLVEWEQVQVARAAVGEWDGKMPLMIMDGAIPFIQVQAPKK